MNKFSTPILATTAVVTLAVTIGLISHFSAANATNGNSELPTPSPTVYVAPTAIVVPKPTVTPASVVVTPVAKAVEATPSPKPTEAPTLAPSPSSTPWVFAPIWPVCGDDLKNFGNFATEANSYIMQTADSSLPVKAIADGIVATVLKNGSTGGELYITMPNDMTQVYDYMSSNFSVTVGQQVKQGDVIGAMGHWDSQSLFALGLTVWSNGTQLSTLRSLLPSTCS